MTKHNKGIFLREYAAQLDAHMDEGGKYSPDNVRDLIRMILSVDEPAPDNSDSAVVRGTYADLKFIKTRKVVQMVIEMPIEAGAAVVEVFGVPQPDQEVWCAVARLNGVASETPPERQSKPFHELSRVQQSGILCKDVNFQEWLGARSTENAISMVKRKCTVTSRRNLEHGDGAKLWDVMLESYRKDTGQIAEERG